MSERITIGHAECSDVTEPFQEGVCDNCGCPIDIGSKRWIEIGSEERFGTFAVGCSAMCCLDRAVTMNEHFQDIRRAGLIDRQSTSEREESCE